MEQTRKTHSRRRLRRIRGRQTTVLHKLCATVLAVAIAAMVLDRPAGGNHRASIVVEAQASFSSLYESFVIPKEKQHGPATNNNGRVVQLSKFDECFRCRSPTGCSWGDCAISIPATVYWTEWLFERLVEFAATFEVLVRGFTLGFGIRMLKYLFFDKPRETTTSTEASLRSILKSYRGIVLVSAVSGLSLAFFLHGSSMFFPATLRESWFSWGDGRDNRRSIDLPRALHSFLRERLTIKFESNTYRKGYFPDYTDRYYYNCPVVCGTERDGHDAVRFDWWTDYALGRVGSILRYATTTLEVLLRGFSMGFGSRMLKFLFFPDSGGGGSGRGEESSGIPPPEAKGEDEGCEEDRDQSHHELFRSFRHKAVVSAISGVSVAAVIHGSSLFVPTELRDMWFDL